MSDQTPPSLDEIKEGLRYIMQPLSFRKFCADIDASHAEAQRQINTLKAALVEANDYESLYAEADRERDALRAEVERLTQENKELREQVKCAVSETHRSSRDERM